MHGPEDSTNLPESETRDPEPGVGGPSVAGVGGPEALEGLQIGPYKLVRFLAKGGMGAVYEARRTDRAALKDKRYALKLIRDGLADDEASVLQHLDHPNIVGVHDTGTEFDGLGVSRHFIVMELVRDALSITEYCRKAKCSIGAKVELIVIACKAIESARGIRHLDLKPSNILIDRYDSLSVCDFGLARLATDSSVGQSGGTPAYMAPEQLTKPIADLDERADEFGLAAVLYELIIGARPHLVLAGSSIEEISREKAIAPPAIHEKLPEADAALNEIVQRGLSFEPDHRFGTVREFRLALESWLAANQTVVGRCARWLRGHTAARVGLLLVVSALLASIVSGYVVSPMLWRSLAWESRVEVGGSAEAVPGVPFEHVTLLALPSGDEIEALAEQHGIEGVRADTPSSWRAMHAALCEKLGGQAGAVVFDFYFEGSADADEDFAASIRACIAGGTPVVVGVQNIRTTDDGVPAFSQPLWEAGVHWGHITISGYSSADTIPLLIDDGTTTTPSLALAAAAALSVREGYPTFTIDPHRLIEADFWAPSSSSRAGARHALPSRLLIVPTAVHPIEANRAGVSLQFAQRGIQPTDTIAWLRVAFPVPATCEASTLPLEEVLSGRADLGALRDRVVLVMDSVHDPWLGPPDARIQGSSVHAAAIEMLMSGQPLRVWSLAEHTPPMLLFGGLGAGLALLGRWGGRRLGEIFDRRLALVSVAVWCGVVLVVLAALVGLQHGAQLLATHASVLANPLPSGAALVSAVPIVLMFGAVLTRVLRK